MKLRIEGKEEMSLKLGDVMRVKGMSDLLKRVEEERCWREKEEEKKRIELVKKVWLNGGVR
jgi:hypothetical protein